MISLNIEYDLFSLEKSFGRMSNMFPEAKLWVDKSKEDKKYPLGWWDEISQGNIGDCYLISALISVSK